MSFLDATKQYSYDTIIAAISPFYNQSQAQALEIAANDRRISSIASAVRSLPAGAARDAAQAKLELISRPQAQIKLDRKAFAARWNKAVTNLNNWAASAGVGVMGPPMLLSGLGAVPVLVPIAIGAAVILLIVGGYLALEHEKNLAVAKGANTLASILGDTTTSPAQKAALIAAYDKAIKDAAAAAGGHDITDAIKSLTLPLLLVAAIVILPKVLPVGKAAA